MSAFQKFNSFVEALALKKHNLGADALKIALCAVAPVATNAVLADLTEISYTNISARSVTTTSCVQTAGILKLILADLTLTASGPSAAWRYVVLYNDSAANKELIGFYDYTASVAFVNSGETFLVDFDGAAGVLQLQ